VIQQKRILAMALGLHTLTCLNSCLYTTHHFNTGEILRPGKTRATFGMGSHRFSGREMLKLSLNYRLGITPKWGPFPGADMGWHLEMPTNPGTMEFDLRLAMPAPNQDWFHHSLSTGWGIGMWADNTFFAEYAASIRYRWISVFTNLRATYLATQFFKVFQSDMDHPLTHQQQWVGQAGLGFKAGLPRLFLLPDFIIPQVILTYPKVPAGNSEESVEHAPQWNINVGTGWRF
jgi:hypothetical protein